MKKTLIVATIAGLFSLGATAETFTGTTRLTGSWSHSLTGVTTVSETFPDSLATFTHTSGTNANQMNQLWRGTVSLSGSGTNEINIAGGITNAVGTALDIAEVRFILVTATSTNGSTISIGGGSFVSMFADSSDMIVLRPGGTLMLIAPDATGYAKGSGVLRIINQSASAASATVYIGGSSS